MSLDVSLLITKPTEVFTANITHNLVPMARAAGIHEALWHPRDAGIALAKDLIPVLEDGLRQLKAYPDRFRVYNAANGWGTYDDFVPWLEEYLDACKEYPNATVEVSI